MDLEDLSGPSDEELAAIELEWPLIAAEMTVSAIEARMLTARRGPTARQWRKLRRAEHRMLTTLVDLLDLAEMVTVRPAEPRLAVAA